MTIILIKVTGIIIRYKRKERFAPAAVPVADNFFPVEQKDECRRPNAVCLLGEFTVYDKHSRDITHLFSPKIKQLFQLIMLKSRENGGVTSKKISSLLWPDKDPARTKNIKGV